MFKKGDRVLKIGPKNQRNNGITGAIDGFGKNSRGEQCYYVLWDGYSERYRERYHEDFLKTLGRWSDYSI